MSHVSIYDTSVKASAGTGDQNNGPTPYPPVPAGEKLKLQPTQTDFAEYISGSVASEKAGTLEVQVSLDYPSDHEDEKTALENSQWVLLEQSLNEETGGKIEVKAGGSKSFVFFANAPYFRLVWTQAAATEEETKAIKEAEEEAETEKTTREATEKTERETWEAEEGEAKITKLEREEKEATQTTAREKDEAEEKVAKEKRKTELEEKGLNEGLYLYARAQEKGRV